MKCLSRVVVLLVGHKIWSFKESFGIKFMVRVKLFGFHKRVLYSGRKKR